MNSRLKVALLAGGLLLAYGVAVWGQTTPGSTTSSVNPLPGSLWTYLGPTLGADWTTPPGVSNAAQPAHYFYAGPTSGANAVPTFRPIGNGDIPSGITIDNLNMTGDPHAPTPLTGDNDNSVATTAFVNNQIGAYVPNPIISGTFSGAYSTINMPGESFGIHALAGAAVTADTATNTMPSSANVALSLYHAFGGASAGEASRIGLWSNLKQVGPIPYSTDHSFHTGIFSNIESNFSMGGTSGTPAGQQYGFAAQVVSGPNNTNTIGIAGMEINVAAYNNSANMVEGMGVGSVPLSYGNPTNHGTQYDAAYGLWAGGSCGPGTLAGGGNCIGFNTGISFGRYDSYFPIADHGTMIRVTQGLTPPGSAKADHGLDFSNVSFNIDAIHTPGFRVLSGGNIEINVPPGVPSPTITMNVQGEANALHRLTYSGLGFYCWQYNTAAAGDFSTVNVAFCVGPSGDIILGPNKAIPTAAAGGFVQLGSMAGTPTGIPNGAGPGKIPVVIDTTNNKLCYYNSGWRCL